MTSKNEDNNKRQSYGLHNTIFSTISKLSYSSKSKIVAMAIVLPIIMIISTLFYCYTGMQDEANLHQKVMTTLKDNEADLLTYAILENSNKARLQADQVKASIAEELLTEYDGNLFEMKKDFLAQTNNKFYRILSKNIDNKFINKNNDNNRMFVASKDGVLIDDSINYSSNSFKSWDEIIKDTPNNQLAQDAIDIIQKKRNATVILWVDNTGTVMNRMEYTDTSYSTQITFHNYVHKLVQENKIDELTQYNVMVVSYIFDTEDIFGVPNIEAGVRNDNDVIYIIQTFNIKDMIESNTYLKSTLRLYESNLNNYNSMFIDNINYRMVIAILFVLLEALAFFSVFYLAEFFVYFHNPKKENNKLL